MENKSITGCEGISNKLLKFIKDAVTQHLTLIINQMIVTGIYHKVLFSKNVIIHYLVIIDLFRCCPQSQKYLKE